jgi:hypothetical protein
LRYREMVLPDDHVRAERANQLQSPVALSVGATRQRIPGCYARLAPEQLENPVRWPILSRRARFRVDIGWRTALKLAQQIATLPQENRRLKAILIKIPHHITELALRPAARSALSKEGNADRFLRIHS